MIVLLHKDLTGRIIKVYYKVYNKLGQTYPEYIYERAMMIVLKREGIACIQQDEYRIWYKEKIVGLQRLDIFVAGEVVVELKVGDKIKPVHLAQMVSYLRTVSKEVGLLFRFGGPSPEFKRRVLTGPTWSNSLTTDFELLTQQNNLRHPQFIYQIIDGTLDVFKALGPGFVHRIYTRACHHELQLRGFDTLFRREFHVFFDGINLGGIKLQHLQIDNRLMLFPVAIADTANLKIKNLEAWMSYLNIPIGILVNFQTTQLNPIILHA